MKKNYTIKLAMGIAIVSVALYGFNPPPQAINSWVAPSGVDTLKNPLANNKKALDEGKKIYDNLCWVCHGLSGKGDGPASTNCPIKPADHTSHLVQKQSDGALFWKISVGKGNMQSYAQLLTPKQRWMLVNYIRTLSTGQQAHQ